MILIHNIPFQSLETKKQLYEKIKFKKPLSVFKTDKIANLHGHEVLRTPVRHCKLKKNQITPINQTLLTITSVQNYQPFIFS
jgi:hypothetical protein